MQICEIKKFKSMKFNRAKSQKNGTAFALLTSYTYIFFHFILSLSMTFNYIILKLCINLLINKIIIYYYYYQFIFIEY